MPKLVAKNVSPEQFLQLKHDVNKPGVECTAVCDLERGAKKATVDLEWTGINFVLPPTAQAEGKTLLHPMTGAAKSQQLLGIMGPSGAGKSTLLDVLAGRIESPYLSGTITTNGSIMDKRRFKRISGYVMQSDALFPLLTVRETVRYAAYLRVQGGSRAEKDAIAERTIALLRLEGCADTKIGDDDVRGLSGGEKRRVSVAVDIVHSPVVVFLDEPTSGLDSSTALSVMESLKELACAEGSTVIMTIHQPSARIFALLDRVIFLVKGRTAYNGSVPALAAHIGVLYKEAAMGEVPPGNMPEVFLDLCDQLALKGGEGALAVVTDKFTDAPAAAGSGVVAAAAGNGAMAAHASESYANSLLGDVAILLHRNTANLVRTPELFAARLGAACGFGVLVGTLFLGTDDSPAGLAHRLSYFVFICAFFYYTSLEALPIFLGEREIFQREYSRGAYRAVSYVLASTLVNFVPYMVVASANTAITWWTVGLPEDANIWFFHVLVVFTILNAGTAFAVFMSTLVPNPMAGQTAGSALLSVMFLFSGFFIKVKDMPNYWVWLSYLSLFRYAFDSMIVNDLTGMTIAGPLAQSNNDILASLGFDGISKWRGVGILWLFIAAYRVGIWYRLTTAFNGSRK